MTTPRARERRRRERRRGERRRGDRRGSALVLALGVLLIANALAAVIAIRVTRGAQATTQRRERAAAFFAAEGGLAEAVQRLALNDPAFVPARPVGEDSSVSVEATIINSLPLEWLVHLEAVGRCRRAEEQVDAVVHVRIDPRGEIGPVVTRVGWERLPGRRAER